VVSAWLTLPPAALAVVIGVIPPASAEHRNIAHPIRHGPTRRDISATLSSASSRQGLCAPTIPAAPAHPAEMKASCGYRTRALLIFSLRVNLAENPQRSPSRSRPNSGSAAPLGQQNSPGSPSPNAASDPPSRPPAWCAITSDMAHRAFDRTARQAQARSPAPSWQIFGRPLIVALGLERRRRSRKCSSRSAHSSASDAERGRNVRGLRGGGRLRRK